MLTLVKITEIPQSARQYYISYYLSPLYYIVNIGNLVI